MSNIKSITELNEMRNKLTHDIDSIQYQIDAAYARFKGYRIKVDLFWLARAELAIKRKRAEIKCVSFEIKKNKELQVESANNERNRKLIKLMREIIGDDKFKELCVLVDTQDAIST